MKLLVKAFFDKDTSTLTYVAYDAESKDAVVIDPVWNYDALASQLYSKSVQEVSEFIQSHELTLHCVLETHVHADHVSGAQVLKKNFPKVKNAIGTSIQQVQSFFKKIFNFDNHFPTNGSQFEILLEENKPLQAGTLLILPIRTPGHTPVCLSLLIGDAVFTGDALFMPDSGTGRCDFPMGSAENLYHSVHEKLYQLPDSTRVFVGHDYQPNGRELKFESTIGEQKKSNIHIRSETKKEDYVDFRKKRDATLPLPKLLYQSVQININAGNLMPSEKKENHYLKIPLSLRNS